MSHFEHSSLSAYNSLCDGHLAGYFSNTRMKRHLRKAGLVSSHGEIISENTYRLNMAQKEHKRHVKDLLAQAIVHKTLDLERSRQAQIKRKLEEIAKIERVRKVRASRNKSDQHLLPYLSPRSRTQWLRSGSEISRTNRKVRASSLPPPSDKSDRSDSQISIETDETEIIYVDDEGQPITFQGHDRSVRKSRAMQQDVESRHAYTLDLKALRRYAMNLAQYEQGFGHPSPYLVPQVPIPPVSPRVGHNARPRTVRSRSGSAEKSPRRTTSAHAYVRLHRNEPAMRHASATPMKASVEMRYHGCALHLAREQVDPQQEVVIEQQHCGGNTRTVVKRKLKPGETFSFESQRHHGYPFSLTIYVDGRQDCRVSTCCEYRHHKGVRLGGRQGHFSIVKVANAPPCYKCQVEKGGKKRKPKPVVDEKAAEIREEVTIVKEEFPEQKTAPKHVEEEDDYEDDFENSESGSSTSSSRSIKDRDNDEKTQSEQTTKQESYNAGSTEEEKPVEEMEVQVEREINEDNNVIDLDGNRKVEGYSSEEEDLEGDKNVKVVIENRPDDKKLPVPPNMDVDLETSDDRLPISKKVDMNSESSDEKLPVSGKVDAESSSRSEPTKKMEVESVSSYDKETLSKNIDDDFESSLSSRGMSSSRSDTSSSSGSSSATQKSLDREIQRAAEGKNEASPPSSVPDRPDSPVARALLQDSPDKKEERNDMNKKQEEKSEDANETSGGGNGDSVDDDSSTIGKKKVDEKEKLALEEANADNAEEEKTKEKEKAGCQHDTMVMGYNMHKKSKGFEMEIEQTPIKKQWVEESTDTDMTDGKAETDGTDTQDEQTTEIDRQEVQVTDRHRKDEQTSETERYDDQTIETDKPDEQSVHTDRQDEEKTHTTLSYTQRNFMSSENEDQESYDGMDKKTDGIKSTENGKDSQRSTSTDYSEESSSESSNTAEAAKTDDKIQNVEVVGENVVVTAEVTESTYSEVAVTDEKVKSEPIEEEETHMEYLSDEAANERSSLSGGEEEEVSETTTKDDDERKDEVERKEEEENSKETESEIKTDVTKQEEDRETEEEDRKKEEEERKKEESSEDSSLDSSESSSDESETEGEFRVTEKDSSEKAGGTEQKTQEEIKESEESQRDITPSADKEDGEETAEQTQENEMEKSTEDESSVENSTDEKEEQEEISPHIKAVTSDPGGDDQTEPSVENEQKENGEVEQAEDKDVLQQKPLIFVETAGSDVESERKMSAGETEHTRQQSTSDASDGENMQGGNDPDNVAAAGVPPLGSQLQDPPPRMSHSGSIIPLLETQDTELELSNLELTKTQWYELAKFLLTKENTASVILNNMAMDDSDFEIIFDSLLKSPSKPMILNLNINKLGPESADNIADLLKGKPSIEVLLLQGNPIGDEGTRSLVDGLLDIQFDEQQWKKAETAKRLEAEDTFDDPVLKQSAEIFCHLKQLDLGNTDITDEGTTDIALLLEHDTDLQTLGLQCNRYITRWTKIGKSLAKNHKLVTLTMDHNNVGDDGIEALVEGLKSNTSVKVLDLVNTGIGQKGGTILIELLKKNTSLLELTLTPGNSIPEFILDDIKKYLSLNQSVTYKM